MRELAWAAGLFDAEGSISRSRYPRLELAQASQTGQPHSSLQRFHAAVGGIGRVSGPRTVKSGWSRLPQFRWEASSFESVQAVLALLWNDLGAVKRSDAHRALDRSSVQIGDVALRGADAPLVALLR